MSEIVPGVPDARPQRHGSGPERGLVQSGAGGKVGLGLFTLEPSLREDGAGVSCIAYGNLLARQWQRRPQEPWLPLTAVLLSISSAVPLSNTLAGFAGLLGLLVWLGLLDATATVLRPCVTHVNVA